MIYIKQAIDNFTDSNIVSTVSEYSPTTNYLLGDMVRVGSYHYKSLYGTVALPNVGKDPLSNLGTAWFEYEVSNQYAMLDMYSETRTYWEEDGIVEFLRGNKDTLIIGNFTASLVTIEYLNDLDVVIDTLIYSYSVNRGRRSSWTYYITPFYESNNYVIYLPILRKGVKIRVTFSKNGNPTNCGYLQAGRAVFMGKTLEDVSFQNKKIGNRNARVADFQTTLDKVSLMGKSDTASLLIDVPMAFIIDESENSSHQNMVILGKITKCDPSANNFEKNRISWQIEQNILS